LPISRGTIRTSNDEDRGPGLNSSVAPAINAFLTGASGSVIPKGAESFVDSFSDHALTDENKAIVRVRYMKFPHPIRLLKEISD